MKTIEVARSMNITVKGIVLNNVRYKKNELKPEEIEAVTNTKIIQQIPWDKRVLECLSNKVPVIEKYPSSGVGTAFFNLAADLCDREYKKPKIGGLKRFLMRWRSMEKSLEDK
jgi:septum site-determining protein MinD